MKMLMLGLAALFAMPSFAQQPSNNRPQLLRGCEILANMQDSRGPEDAVHAAYCLGLIDGAFNQSYFSKVAPPGIPQFCPPDAPPNPREVAARIATTINEQDLERAEVYGRGTSGMVALGMSYPCR